MGGMVAHTRTVCIRSGHAISRYISWDIPWYAVLLAVRRGQTFNETQGGPTIIKLQWLISTGFFGKDDHPDMFLSITGRTFFRFSVRCIRISDEQTLQ